MRVQQVRNMGMLDGNALLSTNDWEQVKSRGDKAIETWIDEAMKYKRCLIALIGSETANRKWVLYEIKKAWDAGKGVMGIHIHNLRDPRAGTSAKGSNPFWNVSGALFPLALSVEVYNPPAEDAYNYIATNIQDWVNDAIAARKSLF